MGENEWFGALTRLINRKAGGKKGEFAAAFAEALSAAEEAGVAAEKLEGARKLGRHATAWIDAVPLTPADQWRAARAVRDLRMEGIPGALIDAALARMPARLAIPTDVAVDAILGDGDKWWLEFLVARKYLPLPKLVKLAKSRPVDFYRSVGLDVLVQRQKACPRPVWLSLAKGVKRPEGLLTGEEALVRSFGVDLAADAARWFCAFTASAPDIAPALITALLRHPAAAARVAAYVGSALPGETIGKGRKAKAVLPDLAEALLDHACNVTGELASDIGMQVVDVLQVLASLTPSSAASAPVDAAARKVAERSTLRVRSALLRFEGESEEKRDVLVVARAEALYRAVQQYLRELPVAMGGEAMEPERARRIARYEGQRDVLSHVLAAMDEVPGPGAMRDALDAALFSLGVRDIGAKGETVTMDSALHEPTASGILPSTPVAVLSPGRRLGGEDGPVLVRAKVTVVP